MAMDSRLSVRFRLDPTVLGSEGEARLPVNDITLSASSNLPSDAAMGSSIVFDIMSKRSSSIVLVLQRKTSWIISNFLDVVLITCFSLYTKSMKLLVSNWPDFEQFGCAAVYFGRSF